MAGVCLTAGPGPAVSSYCPWTSAGPGPPASQFPAGSGVYSGS